MQRHAKAWKLLQLCHSANRKCMQQLRCCLPQSAPSKTPIALFREHKFVFTLKGFPLCRGHSTFLHETPQCKSRVRVQHQLHVGPSPPGWHLQQQFRNNENRKYRNQKIRSSKRCMHAAKAAVCCCSFRSCCCLSAAKVSAAAAALCKASLPRW